MRSVEEVYQLLQLLETRTAEELEGEDLELKPWEPDPRRRLRILREYVVCLAHGRGGTIVLGVRERTRGITQAIGGIGEYDATSLRRGIYDGTDPHVLVELQELPIAGKSVLLVHVPRGIPPHTTSEGLTKIRVGKDCQPLTGQMLVRLLASGGQRDPTAEPVPGVGLDDLDPREIDGLRAVAGRERGSPTLSKLDDRGLLEALGLVAGGEVTLAALLLLGRAEVLARRVPQHEVSFLRYRTATRYDQRHDLRAPLLAVLRAAEDFVSLHNRIRTVQEAGFRQLEFPDLSWEVAREAVLNALTHRDYFLRQSVHVGLYRDRLEVTSPGGFIGGITPANVLRHPTVHRNELLARTFQTIGLVNRVGLGVDRIYEGLLRLGKEVPRYVADEASVKLVLPLATDERFALFVAREEREGRPLELDALLVLRALVHSGVIDRWSAAEVLQLPDHDAAGVLADLRERGYLTVRGRGRAASYGLRRGLAERLRGQAIVQAEVPIEEEHVRLRVRALLEQRGRLTNAEIRRLSGFSRMQVYRLLKELEAAGEVRFVGRGRGAYVVAGEGR